MMLAVLLVLVSISFPQSSAQLYYVSANAVVNETCTVNGGIALRPCYSFNQLSVNKTILSNKTWVALHLLSERYSNPNFVASNVGRLEILPWIQAEKVAVKCELPEELVFHDVGELKIFSVNFFSCTLQYSRLLGISNADLVIGNCGFSANPLKYAINIANRSPLTKLEISINNCTFSSNNGAVSVDSDSSYLSIKFPVSTNLLITDTEFLHNSRGCLFAREANLSVNRSTFINNTAYSGSGAITFWSSGHLKIYGCRFENNSAKQSNGGAIGSFSTSSLVVINSSFEDNFAKLSGGAISAELLKCSSCCFEHNSAGGSGGAIYIYRGSDYGDVYNRNHQTHIEDSSFNFNEAGLNGGAMYCQKYPRKMDSVIFSRSSSISNSAKNGGFLHLSGCHFSMVYKINIVNNQAENGGAIYSEDSRLTIESSIFVPIPGIVRNFGVKPTSVTVTNSTAKNRGGALFLIESNLKVGFQSRLIFNSNVAGDKGGAIYVLDNECEVVLNSSQCFITIRDYYKINETLVFQNNRAKLGSILYGGLLDRCLTDIEPALGIERFQQIVPSTSSAITSDVTKVCLCVNGQPDCSVREVTVTKIRGQNVNPMVASVDQLETPVASSILAHYTKITAELGKGEGRQLVYGYCTQLSYHIFTELSSAILVLQPEGSCERSPFSRISVQITVQNCTTGFEQLKDRCICDRRLIKHLGNVMCSIDALSVSGKGSAWFRYDEEYLRMHTNCPLDYCHAPPKAVSLSSPDEQCANHRSGVTCGACRDKHSIALGSSRCLPCTSRYTFIWLMAVFAVAGAALVALLLVCNMTISSGTLNGLIFYANIVSISGLTSLQNCSIHPILSVFIAWLNLDFGVEICFYPGMDTYQKTWLQFIFPLYIFLLVAAILVASYYSSRAMRVFGRNNIAILATLFLLSYSKILKTIITALDSTQVLVSRADNVSDTVRPARVWTYDGNIEYLKGKHVALFAVALLLLVFLFLPYTLLLTFGQCVRSMSVRKSWVARLIHGTVFISIMDAYHAPYKRRHRYWTGFMLLTRCVLFLAIASVSDISTNMYIITLVIIGILVVKTCAMKMYKNPYLDVLELWFHLNLVALSSTLCYLLTSSTSAGGSTICKCTSASFSFNFIAFFGILGYHAYLQLQKTRYFVRIKQALVSEWPTREQHTADIEEHVMVSSDKKLPTTTMVELREELLASDEAKNRQY